MKERTALDTYIKNVHIALDALKTINEYIDNHGNVSPEDVTWTDVAEMNRNALDLNEIADRINGTGEYAN